MGEITTIQLRGSTKYILRRDAFLAKTEKVSLNLGLEGVKGKHTVSKKKKKRIAIIITIII